MGLVKVRFILRHLFNLALVSTLIGCSDEGFEVTTGQGNATSVLPPVALEIDQDIIPQYTQGNLTIVGSCEGAEIVQIDSLYLSQIVEVTCEDELFSAELTLNGRDGEMMVFVSITDGVTEARLEVTTVKDSTPPAVEVLSASISDNLARSFDLSGNCETSVPITFEGDVDSVSPAVCTDGAYSTTGVLTEGDGPKEIRISQTDPAQNTGVATQRLVLDSQAPVVTIAAPAAGAMFNTDTTINGTCESDIAVVIGGAGVLAESQVMCEDQAYSAALVFSAGQGAKAVEVSQMDAAGNRGSAVVNVTFDSVAPDVTVVNPVANSQLPGNNFTITGTCETGLNLNFSGNGLANDVTVACSGNFSQLVSFSNGDGAKAFTVSQTDGAGNMTTVNRTVVRDTRVPAVQINVPQANALVRGVVQISGTCESGLGLLITGDALLNDFQTTCSNGRFNNGHSVSAGDGPKTIIVRQTDLAGNVGEDTRAIIKDTMAPVVTISQPAQNMVVTTDDVVVSGTCESGINVLLSGSGLSANRQVSCNGSSYSGTVTLSTGNGSKIITASQTDLAGNTGSINRTVTKNTVFTMVSISQPAVGTETDGVVDLRGACESGILVQASGDVQSTSVICTNSNYQLDVTLAGTSGDKMVTVSQNLPNGTTATDTRRFVLNTISDPDNRIPAGFPLDTDVDVYFGVGSCETGTLRVTYPGVGDQLINANACYEINEAVARFLIEVRCTDPSGEFLDSDPVGPAIDDTLGSASCSTVAGRL